MLGLAVCSGIMQLVPAGAELAVRRTLWVILYSSNVVNIFHFFVHVPANGPVYLSCQFSTVYTVSCTLEPHAPCQPKISHGNKPYQAGGMCRSQKDKYMLLVGPDTHFLLLESSLDVKT